MKKNGRFIMYIIWILIGAVLLACGFMGRVDEFWSNMGSALILISVLRLLRIYRINRNAEYRERMEIENTDERNHFIRNKAWAWAGYLFILIMSVSVIVLRVMGQELLSLVMSYCVCLMLVLFWGSYMILRKKY